MREEIERLVAETTEQVKGVNLELDASLSSEGDREVVQAFSEAAANLIEMKQTLKQELRVKCAEIIADITKLQVIMPDVVGPNMSELEPPFKPLLQKLESQTKQFRAIAAARTERKNRAIGSIRDICSVLGLSSPDLDDSLRESDIAHLEAEAESYEARLAERKKQVSAIRSQINDMCFFLSEDPPFMTSELNESALAGLLDDRASLELRYNERNAELSHITTQVNQVAELLNLPSGLNLGGNAIDQLKAADMRLVELNELKRKCIAQVVANARVKILEEWDQLFVDSAHRGTVKAMCTEEASEEILESLEAERLNLQQLRDDPQRQEIVTLLYEYSDLRRQEQELAEASRDPKRLAQRGFSQILKREEATRKLLERKKPPLMQKLLPLLEKWTQEHNGASFLLEGVDIRDIADQERAKLERRSRTSLPRKRPTSTNSHTGAGMVAAKRVKPTVSTPMLRQPNLQPTVPRPRPLPSMSRGGERVPLPIRKPYRPNPHTIPAGKATPAPLRQRNTPGAPTTDAVQRTAAIRAASRAIEANRCKQNSRPVSQPGLALSRPNTMRRPVATPHQSRVNQPHTIMGAGQDVQIRNSSSIPSSQQPQKPSQLHKQPLGHSTPMVSQPPARQPLAPRQDSSLNLVQPNKPMDWRAQRKADLQENGLSYYEDSTVDLSAHGPQPGEESFNFKHFF